jgi:uncharacterized protein YcbX
MSNTTPTVLGSVVGLWRYPVKSMMGEALHAPLPQTLQIRGTLR